MVLGFLIGIGTAGLRASLVAGIEKAAPERRRPWWCCVRAWPRYIDGALTKRLIVVCATPKDRAMSD
jgi:hypothetical protein